MWPFRKPVQQDPSPVVPEIPPTDPMVLCPSCGLLGYHSIDEVQPGPIRVLTGADGERIEVSTWQSLAGYFRRVCCFCSHGWSVPLRAAG